MLAGIFDAVAGFIGEFAEIYFPGVGRQSQHVNVRTGAKNAILCAGDHHRCHFGMFETDALQGVVQFNVHTEIVGIQLEPVAGPHAAFLVHIHGQRRNRAIKREPPMLISGRMRIENNRCVRA